MLTLSPPVDNFTLLIYQKTNFLPIPLHSLAMYGGEFFPLPWIGISQNSVGIFSYMEWSTICIKQSATISEGTDGTTC